MAGLTCNIDRGGRIYRGVLGIVLLAIALFWYSALPGQRDFWAYIGPALFALVGLFKLFEALVGWCALRAMGIKTRL